MQISVKKVILYFCLIFAGGAAAGVIGHVLYSAESVSAKALGARTNDDWRHRYVESMRKCLHLDEAQIKQLNDTLDETRVEYRLLRQRYKPEMEMIHQQQVTKIKSFLRQDQIAGFEKLEKEREEKLRSRESGPGL